MKKDITFVIPWSNRPELETTLKSNIDYLNSAIISYDILVVNCGGNTHMLESILAKFDSKIVKSVVLNETGFNKSLALNKGITVSKSNYFMCLDADIILLSIDFKEIFAKIEEGYFVTIQDVNEQDQVISPISELDFEVNGVTSFKYKIELEKKDGSKIEIDLNKNDLINNRRSAPGILITRMEDIVCVNGYNSELEGWGWEDIDLIVRLQFAGLKRLEMGSVLHLTHNDNMRYIDSELNNKSENENFNFQRCMINYQLGIFEGTLMKDFDFIIQKD